MSWCSIHIRKSAIFVKAFICYYLLRLCTSSQIQPFFNSSSRHNHLFVFLCAALFWTTFELMHLNSSGYYVIVKQAMVQNIWIYQEWFQLTLPQQKIRKAVIKTLSPLKLFGLWEFWLLMHILKQFVHQCHFL